MSFFGSNPFTFRLQIDGGKIRRKFRQGSVHASIQGTGRVTTDAWISPVFWRAARTLKTFMGNQLADPGLAAAGLQWFSSNSQKGAAMKWCPTPRFLAVVTAALLISLFAVSGFAQFQTGNIYGKVQAKDGSVLPGVTVTLTGIGAPQTTVTDAQGNFRFLNLSPGTYTIKSELAGYGTATRAGVGVRVGSNSDVTLTLNPSVSESIVVTAEAPLLDVRKAGTAINVSKVELEKIPTSRDPWTILQQAPAVQVDRINVGGNQSGQQSVYVGKGTTADQNTWNVDGVNITDMGAVGSSPLYFDFDSFEEMQVTTGGSDPRIMTPGVQLNMVTKRGTNDFRGSGRYFYTPGSYQANASVPGEAAGYLAATNEINFVRDFGGEIGGPIWKDHVWAWIADSENKISNRASQNISASGTVSGGAFDNIILRDKNAKLNAQVLPSNSAVGFYTFGDKVRNARNLGPTRPFETAWRQTGPTKVYKIEDTQIIGSSLYLTGMWSKVTGGFSLIANGGAVDAARDITGVWHNSFESYITDRPQKQYRLDGSKFFDIGTMNHELKFGFGYRHTPVGSISTWPGPNGGWTDFRSNTFCTSRGFPTGCYLARIMRDKVVEYDQNFRDLYAGDTVLLGNLTLQAGLRYDVQKTKNLASASNANPTLATPLALPCLASAASFCGSNATFTTSLPALTFPGDTRQLKWDTISPRIGLTYTLGADKKTLLRAGYNRYVNQIGPLIASINPVNYAYAYAVGNDTNGNGVYDRNELVKWFGFNYYDPFNPGAVSASNTRIDYGMTPPHTDELIVGFERELLTDFSVGVNGTYRKIKNLPWTRAEKTQGAGDFYTRNDFELATCGSAVCNAGGTYPQAPLNNGGFSVTVPSTPIYDLKAGIPAPSFFVITNAPGGYSREYKGLEVVATKRLSNRWMLRGNVSYNDWTESCNADAYPNPTPGFGNC
ncbi:MAG TPA: carboxypeptidase regulatory-like domain-containing protein, partial [Thermoanaerobaculia bacterium]|nr:carboxypeptidase regulatory-like domain-containing protein [Thermoanaerobaculia bacterium]